MLLKRTELYASRAKFNLNTVFPYNFSLFMSDVQHGFIKYFPNMEYTIKAEAYTVF